jgi:hypothetical protein
MQRWVMPVELSRDWLMQLNQDLGRERQQFEVEVFAYGHLPLAYSARCFTARSLDRPKDNCELACIHYPTGRLASSREGQKVFNLNGIQTQSGYCYNLGNEPGGWRGWWMWCASPRRHGDPDDAGALQGQRTGDGPCPCSRSGTATVTGARSPA